MRRLIFFLALCCPAILGAQNRSTATLGSVSVVFAAPTVNDYLLGYKDVLSAIPYTYVVNTGNRSRSVTVGIYTTVSSLGGTKPSSNLQFKKSGQPTTAYQSIPCCSAPGTSFDSFTIGANGSYSSAIDLRMILNAATDAPGTYTTGAAGITIVFTQVVL